MVGRRLRPLLGPLLGRGGGIGLGEDEDAAAAITIPFRDAVLGGTVSFSARIPRRCSRCRGTGRAAKGACPACHGSGSLVETESLTVRIPAGVDTGARIRVPGKGRTENGDLYLSLTVEPHPYFSREGDDIVAEVPVTVPEAYLGAEIEVPTVRGPVRARIPAGTVSGQRFRLKGRGIENLRTGTTGDHYYSRPRRRPDGPERGGAPSRRGARDALRGESESGPSERRLRAELNAAAGGSPWPSRATPAVAGSPALSPPDARPLSRPSG